jgi:hypothetical protein
MGQSFYSWTKVQAGGHIDMVLTATGIIFHCRHAMKLWLQYARLERMKSV